MLNISKMIFMTNFVFLKDKKFDRFADETELLFDSLMQKYFR